MLIRHPGPKVDEDTLRLFEIAHEVTFPPDYRRFLLECNGGKPFPDAFLAPNDDVEVTVGCFYSLYHRDGMIGSLASLWDDPNWIKPLAEGYIQIADDTGNQPISMMIKGELTGRIVIGIDGAYYYAAASFHEFLFKLEKREGLGPNFLAQIIEESILAKPESERGYNYVIDQK